MKTLILYAFGSVNAVMEKVEEAAELEADEIADDFETFCGYDRMEDWQLEELNVY